jgi:hypothetical protein
MSVFKVDYNKLVVLLLPTMLRKQTTYAFLKASIAPIKSIYYTFYARRTDTLFLLKYDTSKGNVERALRAKFGAGIYIKNAVSTKSLTLPFTLPAKLRSAKYRTTVVVAKLPLKLPFTINKTTATSDFFIYVPNDIYNVHLDEIRDFAGYFTLPAFKFEIINY